MIGTNSRPVLWASAASVHISRSLSWVQPWSSQSIVYMETRGFNYWACPPASHLVQFTLNTWLSLRLYYTTHQIPVWVGQVQYCHVCTIACHTRLSVASECRYSTVWRGDAIRPHHSAIRATSLSAGRSNNLPYTYCDKFSYYYYVFTYGPNRTSRNKPHNRLYKVCFSPASLSLDFSRQTKLLRSSYAFPFAQMSYKKRYA